MTGSRRVAKPAAGGLLVVLATMLIPGIPVRSASATGPDGFSNSLTITRAHLVGGKDSVVDRRQFSLAVDTTRGIRDRQEVNVSWSGAHPTGGIIADQNAASASQEEYPVVLLQCRGIDSAAAPAKQRIDPTTCWTQSSVERFYGTFNSAFPPWRLDRYAAAADRQALVRQPNPRPKGCQGAASAERWVPYAAADGTTYQIGENACAGLPPEASNVGGLALPGNTTYGVSRLDGTGSAKFDVLTAEDNASIGCSDTVPCAIVAVPIMGISCDTSAAGLPPADRPAAGDEAKQADAACTAKGTFKPGDLTQPRSQEDPAVSGLFWWSASNWRNRVVVPLNFAPLANVCQLLGNHAGVDIYGSELFTQATLQWSPAFCLNPGLFSFQHVQTGEPQARHLLSAHTIEAAFTSNPPPAGYGRPVVNAPVAVSGFGIGYTVDDAKGAPYQGLRLTPRLLAKLLTESYPSVIAIHNDYPALAHNPLDISLDPEFIALNPGIKQGVQAGETASTLLTLSSDSDVVRAMTSYLTADPEARAWLDGAADPWGMTVNPNYKGIALPVDSWPLLDTFEPKSIYRPDLNDCLSNNPVPYLPLIAAPMSRLRNVALAMQFSIANSQIICLQPTGTSAGEKLVGLGRQTAGFRFMLGVVSLADAARYQIDQAALQTQVAPGSPAKFTDATGRSFAAPSNASLLAAAKLLARDTASATWPIPYAQLRSTPAAAAAYPGTMVIYAAVPTSGLPKADAAKYAQLLKFAAVAGQVQGPGNGQLPAGYLPLTAANNLGALSAYTLAAADAVAAQLGLMPVLGSPSGSAAVSGQPGSGVPTGSGAVGSGGPGSTVSNLSSVSDPGALTSPAVALAVKQRAVLTGSRTAGIAGMALPALLALMLGAAGAALLTSSLGREKVQP